MNSDLQMEVENSFSQENRSNEKRVPKRKEVFLKDATAGVPKFQTSRML